MCKTNYTNYTGQLSATLVDEFSNCTYEVLTRERFQSNDITRFRLSVESAMCVWLEKLGEGAECTFNASRRLGRLSISITCKGVECDPREDDGEEFGSLPDSSLLQTLGLSVGYSYDKGINRIDIMPKRSTITRIIPVLVSMALAIALALIFLRVFPSQSATISEQYISPIFTTLMNLLRTIAGPLIFLAVLSGIYSIGDVSTLGKIGKKLLARFVLMTFLALGFALLLLIFIVNVQVGHYEFGGEAMKDFLTMILQFVPTDIVSPFINGNMLQIIFMATCCGAGMLILGKKVSVLTNIVEQIYSVVQLLMETIGKLIPLFVFISIFDFILSGNATEIGEILYPFLIILASVVAMILYYSVRIKLTYNMPFKMWIKKIFPTFIIAVTTASSAAAFSTNMDTCEKELGISKKITRFGIPLGQVVYMPIAAVEYLSISMILANANDVSITPMWIVTAIIVCGILAIATPPIPGGAMSIFTVLFAQLNIPVEYLAIAISTELLVDYIVTAGDLACLQGELVISSGKMNYLDEKQLLSK